MKLVDWLDQSREHTKEEMVKCAARGECNQCGLCCVAFEDRLPIRIPETVDEPVSLTRKAVLTVCPHLATTEEGSSLCQAHHIKDHPALQHCRDWHGPGDFNPEDFPGISHFDVIVNNFWTWVLLMCNSNDLHTANKFIEKGFIHWGPPSKIEPDQLETFLKKLIRLDRLPLELLALMNLRRILETFPPKRLRILKSQLGLNRGDIKPAQRELIRNYFPTN